MHLKKSILIVLQLFACSFFVTYGQTFDAGCQTQADADLDLDRKDFAGGTTNTHSGGAALNFALPPASDFDACKKITEVTVELTINDIDVSGVPNTFPILCAPFMYYLNIYTDSSLPFGAATIPTDPNIFLDGVSATDWPDLPTTFTYTCDVNALNFDYDFGVDLVPAIGPGQCPDFQTYLIDGTIILDYEVCVSGVVGDAGPLPDAVANAVDDEVCEGVPIGFTEDGGDAMFWAWDGPNGWTGSGPAPFVAPGDVVAAAAGVYTVTVTDDQGCTNTDDITISVLSPPNAMADAVTLEVCPGQDIELLETAGDAIEWAWTGPMAFSSSDQNPIISGATSGNLGTYFVEVTDSNDCQSTSEVTIIAATPPDVIADAVSTEVCPGEDIELLENGGEGDMWSWTGPDGFTSTDQNPIITSSTTDNLGIYMVTVTSAAGCSNIGQITISPATPPDADADADPFDVCLGGNFDLFEIGGEATSWSWTGPAGFTSTDQNPSLTGFTNANIGTYTVEVTDGAGCTNTSQVIISLADSPEGCLSGVGSVCEDFCGTDIFAFDLSPSSGLFDITLTFPGTSIDEITLTDIVDGQAIGVCSDALAGTPDFDGTNLILPTSSLADGETIIVQIESLVDTNTPDCAGVPDPICELEIEFSEAANLSIEFDGNELTDGQILNCVVGFNPVVDDPSIAGTWTIDGDPVTLPEDLTAYPPGNHVVAYVPDPGECAFPVEVSVVTEPCADCMILDALLTDVICNSNSTLTDDTDDFITFTLDPQAVFEGMDYDVDVSSGSINPSFGTYGGPTDFELQAGSAGGGDITLTITDVDDGSCFIEVVIIDPGSCSSSCNITTAVIDLVACNDNGTDSDPTDDFVSFVLEIDGDNLGADYSFDTPYGSFTGTYGTSTSFDFPPGSAGAGDLVLTITDSDDPACTSDVMLEDPGTCSGSCNIEPVIVAALSCDDNGTGDDPNDDFLTFDIDPQGVNLTGDYTIGSSSGVSPSMGTFGGPTSFSTSTVSPAGGIIMLTIISVDDPTCMQTFEITDPGPCSDECVITNITPGFISCDANGTDANPSDDIINFQLQVDGTNVGSGYTFTSPFGMFSGNYGVLEDFMMTAGSAEAGDFILNITDNENPNCIAEVTIVNPGSCSGGCNITDADINFINCDSNGTDSDDTDDVINFQILVDGASLGSGYSFDTPFGTFTGSYGQLESFQLPAGSAGAGDILIEIVDNDNPDCFVTLNIPDPGTCSDACFIDPVMAINIACDNNGTDTDAGDDFLTFEIDPQGSNLSGDYSISSSYGITPVTGSFGGPTMFTTDMAVDNGDIFTVVITSIDDPTCTTTFDIVDPGSCSDICALSADIMVVTCSPNSTDDDPTDDLLIFLMQVEGDNAGSGYSFDLPSGTFTGDYGTFEEFELDPGTAGAGDIDLVIFDNDDPDCFTQITVVDPGTCSGACSLDNIVVTTVDCDDNNSADDADDFLIFTIEPIGSNLVGDFMVTSTEYNITPPIASFGGTSTFETDGLSTEGEVITLTLTSIDDPSCTMDFDILDVGPCSTACSLNATVVDVFCDPNGTDTDATDDIISIQLEVEGIDAGSGYSFVSSGGFFNGDYGVQETFDMAIGSAGDGDFTITIVDDDDPNCTTEVMIIDPGVCSDACITSVEINDITCFTNQTASTTFDDFLTFTISPVTTLTGQYTISTNFDLSPPLGTFGQESTFATGSLNQNGGILVVTIVSLDDPSCSFTFEIIDPGPCSVPCPDPGNCNDGDQCNGEEEWNDNTCECVVTDFIDETSCIDDSDCTNGIEFWDDIACECLTEEPLDCTNGGGIEMPCDDGNPCTGDDVMIILDCDGSECIPCAGVPLDCAESTNTTVLPCDDGVDFTINDVEIVLSCDGSVCQPCEGIVQLSSIFFPQIFTPDGDGDNDEWGIFTDQDLMIREFKIFSRWGEVIYATSDVMSSDDSHRWNGRRNDGVKVSSGVYVYYLEIGAPYNSVFSGDLTLVY